MAIELVLLALASTLPPQAEVGERGERLPEAALGEGRIRTPAAFDPDREDPEPGPPARTRRGRQGEWIVPGIDAGAPCRSGDRCAVNRFGDTRMGIGFGEAVDLSSAWLAGQASPSAWADGVRAIGFRDGVEVGRTDWFGPLSHTPRRFTIDLEDVDRVVFEARPVVDGAGWYALDDLAFTRRGADDPQPVVVDFEDLEHRTTLTGSGHAGLEWETGTGTFDGEPRAIPAPRVPPGEPESVRPPGGTALPSVASGGTLPEITRSFFGMRQFENGTSAIPPDTCGAIGPTQFASVVNVKLAVFDRVTGDRLAESPLADFFGAPSLGDPRITYDHHANRWFLLCSSGPSTARLYLAISLTDDAAGPWYTTFIEAAQGSDVGRWPDYPTLGFDQNGYYAAALMVPSTMTIWAIDKAPLLDASPSLGTVTAWRDRQFEGAIQPCVTHGTPPAEYLVSRRSDDRLRLRRIMPPLTSPTLVNMGTIDVPTNTRAPAAPALGSNVDIATGDTRPMNAVHRDGAVYTAHTIDVDGRAACRWYELDVASVALTQYGTIADPVRYYHHPSISVNAAGHMALGFSGSHAGEYVGAFYTGRNAWDPPGVTAPPAILRQGFGPYNHIDGNGIARWGDYSLTSIDPLDDDGLWTIQASARANNRWGTRIAELRFTSPCPTPWPACDTTPNSVGAGARVDVAGNTSLSANTFALTVSGCVPFTSGIFFFGPDTTEVPVGNGSMCVGGGIHRLPVVTMDLGGNGAFPFDLTDPALPGGLFVAGSTWTFQFWYRDVGVGPAGFDFSDAICATFCP